MYICTYIYKDIHIIIRQEDSSESEEIDENRRKKMRVTMVNTHDTLV